uniref:PB1 domain-containing protein n=1 Tax=Lutzomyia longipalpis TaxID=7200 RepID=A0A1B0CKH7_LUTLO
MPTPVLNESNNSSSHEIIVKTAYNGQKMITYISESITFDELCEEIRGMCQFSPDQVNQGVFKSSGASLR